MEAKLKDVTLSAIVRDEMINPAGGVERWLRSSLPYVEEAVVVDTGSIDGTYQKLVELEEEFSNLRVYSHPFKSYFDARNFSLEKVNTKFAFILDADEVLASNNLADNYPCGSIPEGFLLLNDFIFNSSSLLFDFSFFQVYPDIDYKTAINVLNPRLFSVEDFFGKIRFWGSGNKEWEESLDLNYEEVTEYVPGNILIYHFNPLKINKELKVNNWYKQRLFESVNPSEVDGFLKWKEFNSKRDIIFQ